MARIFALVMFLALIGFAGMSAYDTAARVVTTAKHAQNIRMLCAESAYMPRAKLTDDYVAVCHGGN